MKDSFSASYAAAGVDITAGYESVSRIKPLVESTYTPGVLGGLGGFGGMFELKNISGMERPVAVSGTDGVGTKLKIAFLMDKHDTVGIDCVAMCVNDIVCSGAAPLFFMDYVAMGKNIPQRTEEIVSGIAEGCRQAGCALIGGETAEMPGFYPEDEYDLAGFSVGLVDYKDIIDGSSIAEGDLLIGIASSGLHSNGFSLVRKIFDVNRENLNEYVPELGKTLGEELLTPTRIYVSCVLKLIEAFKSDIKGICHITGGGFYENIPRMLPENVQATVNIGSFPVPPIFGLLAKRGNIPERDMYNTFNMGIGLVLAVPRKQGEKVLGFLRNMGESAYIIGSCNSGEKGVELVW
ncbi:MAG TPA: phosphoribosylformylglycinamidine cyclo-ligase [Clostridiales bacterium]|nr:phosphoribosylformylglycinamidine cyclo-ligase [Clostridiales bacterium]